MCRVQILAGTRRSNMLVLACRPSNIRTLGPNAVSKQPCLQDLLFASIQDHSLQLYRLRRAQMCFRHDFNIV